MSETPSPPTQGWCEEDTRTFLDLARYAVPGREAQIAALVDLVPASEKPFDIIDLGCGEGLLSAALLDRFPQAWITALDGSAAMLARARARCQRFGVRFTAQRADLGQPWPRLARAPRTVVSSLALHHLEDSAKKRLFQEIFASLTAGGALLIADLVQPASTRALAYAAQAWDDAVRDRARQLDGDSRGFDAFVAEGWNLFRHPDLEVDRPAPIFSQLAWLREAGFVAVDVFWMQAGHALFGGRRA